MISKKVDIVRFEFLMENTEIVFSWQGSKWYVSMYKHCTNEKGCYTIKEPNIPNALYFKRKLTPRT